LEWDELAVVGRIARAHGNRGQVIVNLETDFPEARFRPGAEMFVRRRGIVAGVKLASVRFQRGRPVVAFDGIETMDDAATLAGLELRVPIEQLLPLPAGSYYHHDLVGCRVETADGCLVGTVRGVEGPAGRSLLVIEGPAGETLVPLAEAICTLVDPTGKRIVIEPPQGLLDLNR
jgi:16S rRNA processing protein RimM